jgi:hypothetical protein
MVYYQIKVQYFVAYFSFNGIARHALHSLPILFALPLCCLQAQKPFYLDTVFSITYSQTGNCCFRTASEIVSDLSCDSPFQRKRKLSNYGRVDLLCIDEIGYLTYDAHAADLLYEIVNRRYEKGSIVITTNRGFAQWNEVFPHATCIATLLDRLLHHAEVALIEGESYRIKESQAEAAARRKKR